MSPGRGLSSAIRVDQLERTVSLATRAVAWSQARAPSMLISATDRSPHMLSGLMAGPNANERDPRAETIDPADEVGTRIDVSGQAFGIVSLAAAIALGLAALPISVRWPVRAAVAGAAFILTIQLFHRYPSLARKLESAMGGFAALLVASVLIATALVLLVHPGFAMPPSFSRVTAAAAAAMVSEGAVLCVFLAREKGPGMTPFSGYTSAVVFVVIITGLSGALAFVALDGAGGPVRDSFQGAVYVGISTPPVLRALARSVPPLVPEDKDIG